MSASKYEDNIRSSQLSVNSTKTLYKDDVVAGEMGEISFDDGSSTALWKALTVFFALLAIAGVTVGAVCGTGNCSSDSSDHGPEIPKPITCNIDCKNLNWGYTEEDGPDCWAECGDWSACKALKQSPINLTSNIAESLDDFEPLVTIGYNETQEFTITNNGHTVEIAPPEDFEAYISELGLPGEYRLAQFHFHWAPTSAQGSEHTINGQEFPMEVHMVHYNTIYDDIGEAMDKDEGLAVLGLMFRISPIDNPALDDIITALDQISFKGDVASVTLALDNILPATLSDFYRYSGSLTTPPCHESIVWTVFTDAPIEISESQVEAFRTKLHIGSDENSDLLDKNYRPPLALESRSLYFNRQL